jgi:predicted aldo/keto reductase-like oxidoreductase
MKTETAIPIQVSVSDAYIDQIERVVDTLQKTGMDISDIGRITGFIVGTVPTFETLTQIQAIPGVDAATQQGTVRAIGVSG